MKKPLIKALFIAPVLMMATLASNAQFEGDVYRQYNDARVKVGSTELALAWTGGANRPQLAMADLNVDGKEDIVLYEDYIGVKTLIATGKNTYKYDPSYESIFPSTLNGYIKLIDFNGDNIKDLVHRNSAGVGIYYGYFNGGKLNFRYYKDVYYINPSGPVNVHVAPASIPAMDDIDGDGDIDILSYSVWGTLIEFYRNCQVEDGLHKDSVKICLMDNCWGKTYQNFERKQNIGSSCQQWGTTCKGCGKDGKGKGTHGSNTLLVLDMDNDGDMDWFNGNESFPDIQFFYNGKSQFGSVDSAIAQDTIWGANGKQMYMPIYPGAYYLNVNHDETTDLLFTPMTEGTENYNSICLYENVGTNANKNFVFKTNTYLIDRMIDMGTGSYPVFFDYDKDGKDDLFIGSEGFYDPTDNKNYSKIAYYKNTTDGDRKYKFELQTDDFLNLSSKKWQGTALAVGDIDNDSLADLVIGRTDGTFAFFQNQAASDTVQPNWVLTLDTIIDQTNLKVLDVGDYATPCIYDIDGDGKNDLISGNQYGELYYYNNFSSMKGQVGLTKITDTLGGIKLKNINEPYAYSAPYIGKMDNTGIDYLVVGCQWGWFYRYDGFQNGAMPAKYKMIDSSYSYLDVGKRSAPAFANIDNDVNELYELVSGNVLGGVTFYKQDFKVGINDKISGNKDVKVYPNPASNFLNVNWSKDFVDGSVDVQIVSVTGQVLVHQQLDGSKAGGFVQLNDLSNGVYYCIIQSGENRSVQPVTIMK